MSEYGLKVWDAQGQLILSGVDETMRIVTTLQVRLGSVYERVQIPCPLARVGMYGLVQVFHPYTEWAWYPKGASRSSTPSVLVLDGAIQLFTGARARFWGDVDVILVAT